MSILKYYCKHARVEIMCPDCNGTREAPSNDGVDLLARAAMELYRARQNRAEAKKKEIAACSKHCLKLFGEGLCWSSEALEPEEELCDNCKVTLPLYIRRRKTSEKVGIALKALMRLCEKREKQT